MLDVATGTGLVARELVRTDGRRRVVALDPSAPMLGTGIERSARLPIAFVLGRAEELPFATATFDALTVTYLLRYVDDPGATLTELARVVRPGGVVASLEFGVPPNRAWRACWRLYTRAVMPAVGRLVSRDWYEVAGSRSQHRRSGVATRSPNSSVCGRRPACRPCVSGG